MKTSGIRWCIGLAICLFITYPSIADEPETELTRFAENVTLHVVLHELGHGLIREFDLPILGNEETMADAFATFYLTHYMPERAKAIIEARTRSLLI